jgi:hypothetical protein
MAGIDYTIPGQFKGVQIEPPENAMARAMQLRGLQEAAQLNALKMQEYQQQQQESNALAQIIRNPKLKYGSPEFFAEVAARAPRRYADLAAGYEKQKLGEAAEEERRQKTLKYQFEQRQLKREFGLRKIAGAKDYQSAVSLIERGIRTGEIDREEGDDMLGQLHAVGPNTDMAAFRSNVLTNLLPAKEALTAPSDIEKAQLGVRKERGEVQAKELDQALAGFNKTFNPAFISTTDKNVGVAQITQRLRAMYEHPVLGAEAKERMPYEAALKQHLEAYNADPDNYIAAMMGLTGEKIIEARQKSEERREKNIRAAYEEYEFEEALKGKIAGPYSEFKADYLAKQGAAPAPAPEPTIASAAAPTTESTAAAAPRLVEAQGFGRNVPRPEAAPAIAPAAAPASETAAKDELPSLPPVEVNYGIPGVSAAVVSLLRGTPEGRRKLAELAQAEYSPSAAAKRKLDSDRLQADITHRQNMEDIARRSENRQQDEQRERQRHNRVLEGIQKNQFYLQADKPNQVANTQVDDNGTVTHFNARGQVIRSIPNVGKRSPALIKAEEAKAESKRTLDALIPELTKIIEPGGLIDQSTGSGIGRLADVTSEFFGVANEGAIAARELQPIASMVLMTVPRFQGPQSDKDVMEYNKAAGQLADPTLPAKIRRAAGKVVLDLMKKRRNEFVLRGSELDAGGGGGGAGAIEPPAGFVRDK